MTERSKYHGHTAYARGSYWLVLTSCLALVLPASHAFAKAPRRGADGPGERRRGIEPAKPAPNKKVSRKLIKRVLPGEDCHLKGHKALVRTLLGWRNKSQLMSLELWGDTKRYRPGQKVFFFFRSPRRVYVTLFWIGPNGDVIIPMSNTRIKGNRNVRVWTGGIIVPPLGNERWVAVSTLEPIAMKCRMGEANWLKTIAKFKGMPHGVGRWQVHSQ